MRRSKSGPGRKAKQAPKTSQQQQPWPAIDCAHVASQTNMADPVAAEEDRFQALMQAIAG